MDVVNYFNQAGTRPLKLFTKKGRSVMESPITPHWRYGDCVKCGKAFIKTNGKCPFCEPPKKGDKIQLGLRKVIILNGE